jgi:hypothetical protein
MPVIPRAVGPDPLIPDNNDESTSYTPSIHLLVVAPSHMPANVASADNVGDLEDMRGAGEAGGSEAAECNADEGGEMKGMRGTATIALIHSAWSRVQKVIENVGLDKDSNP